MINSRNEFPKIARAGNWIELGVAEGEFSEVLLRNSSNDTIVYSIDRWAGDRLHDEKQYQRAKKRLAIFEDRSIIIRATFDQAVLKFEDGFFDFVYIDGYAHTGQESGKTLEQWWPKVKAGGIFAGHDYHKAWQPTIEAVNRFCVNHGLTPRLTERDEFPSWWVQKL